MDLRAKVEEAIVRSGSLVDATPLRDALRDLEQPWTIAVIGRLGAGKSSLVNALARRPVQEIGLGGVTSNLARVSAAGVVLVDTPGIDDPELAATVLAPAIAGADAVVWVVDGLQPLTASERWAVADALRNDAVPLHVVVSRADLLDPAEVEGVRDRARALTQPLAPASLRVASLRGGDPTELADLLTTRLPGARRSKALRRAVATVRGALEALPPEPDARARVARFRAVVRDAVRSVDAAIERGAVTHKTDALALLALRARDARDAFRTDRALRLLPELDPPAEGTLGQLVDGLSGIEGARRAVRAAAARWLVEGEVLLLEGSDPQETAVWGARRAAMEALDRVEDVRWTTGPHHAGAASESE